LLHAELEDRVFGAAPGRWNLHRCDGCGAAYLDPRPTAATIGRAYSRYFPPATTADAWPAELRLARLRRATWNGYLNHRYGYDLAPASRLAGAIVRLLPKRRWHADLSVRHLRKPRERPRLLDVGFGPATFLLQMRAAGWEVAGIDPDAVAVAAAREQGLSVARGVLGEGVFPDRSFDAITMSHVIEHLHDPAAGLRACARLLEPDGTLWLATPNLDSPGHRRFGADWFGLDPPRHLVLFTRSALGQALAGAGFERVRFERTYRADLVLAGSEAIANETGDAATVHRPASRRLRWLARALDAGAAVRREWGEELIVLAQRE
jgi:2-polyprenyl-3-methyl-5-hydroxy-6-metoxy-1,4-benzoquinol methylase